MGDDQGYDDQFNDGLFRTTYHTSKQERPKMWPKSVSEMRHHTSYGGQGMARSNDAAYSEYMDRRASGGSASGGARAPYYTQPSFHKPFWNDNASQKNGQWHGLAGFWKYDHVLGNWVNIRVR